MNNFNFGNHLQSDKEQEIIGNCSSVKEYAPGQTIFLEGEHAKNVYLICSGKVSLEIFVHGRGPICIQTLGSGDVLGWSWLIPPYQWRFDARTLEKTNVVVLDGEYLRKVCETDNQLHCELLRWMSNIMAQRLHNTRLQLLDVYNVGKSKV